MDHLDQWGKLTKSLENGTSAGGKTMMLRFNVGWRYSYELTARIPAFAQNKKNFTTQRGNKALIFFLKKPSISFLPPPAVDFFCQLPLGHGSNPEQFPVLDIQFLRVMELAVYAPRMGQVVQDAFGVPIIIA